MTEPRQYFHCSSCFTHKPLSAYAGKRRGKRVCKSCAQSIRRRGFKLDEEEA